MVLGKQAPKEDIVCARNKAILAFRHDQYKNIKHLFYKLPAQTSTV